jgi:hypothetical protein
MYKLIKESIFIYQRIYKSWAEKKIRKIKLKNVDSNVKMTYNKKRN